MTNTEEILEHRKSNPGVTASDLEEWAATIEASDDACVQEILVALRADENLTAWAEIDIDRCLPTASEWRSKGAPVRNLLSVSRNVLVFVPIILAWLGIRSASSGYRKAVARLGPDEALDFLSYWTAPERGFERLQNVALMVSVVVSVIIFITIAIAIFDGSANRTRTHHQQTTERERAHVVLKLRLVLTPRRKVDLQNVEASFTSSIDDFKYSSNQLRESTAQLREIFESTESLGPQLEQSTERMNEIVTLMQRDLTGSITSLTIQIRSLGNELTGLDSKLGKSLSDQVDQVIKMTHGVTQDLDILGQRLNQICLAAEASVSRMAALAGPANTVF